MSRLVLGLTILLSAFTFSSAHAGSSDASMSCVSDSGRTSFQAVIGDIDGSVRSMRFTIDGYSNKTDENLSDSSVMYDPDYKVYTLDVQQTRGGFHFVQLIANPKTMTIVDTAQAIDIRFRGRIVGTEPRPNQPSLRSKVIEVSCVMDYPKP